MAARAYLKWLKPGSAMMVAAMLAGCLGSAGPSSEVLRLAAGSDDSSTVWHKAGIENPVFYHLASKARPPEAGFTHQLAPLTYMARRGSVWTAEDVGRFTTPVPMAMAQCGIRLDTVQLVVGDMNFSGEPGTPLTGKGARQARAMIGKSPAAKGLSLLFIDRTGSTAPGSSTGSDGRAGPQPLTALITRKSGPGQETRSQQIALEEIGRMLGLSRLKVTGPAIPADVNLRANAVCPKCVFTPRQCERIKTHTLVKRLTKPQA